MSHVSYTGHESHVSCAGHESRLSYRSANAIDVDQVTIVSIQEVALRRGASEPARRAATRRLLATGVQVTRT